MKPHTANITFTWDPNKCPETKITRITGFSDLDHIEKLDFLSDAIRMLEEKESELLQNKEQKNDK